MYWTHTHVLCGPTVEMFLRQKGVLTFRTQETYPKVLDPSAPPYVPGNTAAANNDVVTLNMDDLPDNLNLLYETTVSGTRLTSTVDKQFRELLISHPQT